MARKIGFLLTMLFGGSLLAAEPFIVVESSNTNLVVSESCTVTTRIYVPAMDEEDRFPPLVHLRPPHLYAPFMDVNWGDKVFESDGLTDSLNKMLQRDVRQPLPRWKLNSYKRDDPFADMPDPFGMFGGGRRDSAHLFAFDVEKKEIDGVKWWCWTLESAKITAKKIGKVETGPVRAELSLLTKVDERGNASFRQVKVKAKNPPVLTVSNPPLENRPRFFFGAIGRAVTVSAALDASTCKRGDPMLLTVTLAGEGDFSLATSPRLAPQINGSGFFRVDDESVRSETAHGERRFIYRLRALKEGTTEFPALLFAYYDLGAHDYRVIKTASIPFQVLPGSQVILEENKGAQDSLPLPDGFDFSESGAAPMFLLPKVAAFFGIESSVKPNLFTWNRAASKAVSATTPEEFLEVAEVYREMIRSGVENPVIYSNLGASLVMAGRPAEAVAAYSKAERYTGLTMCSRRGIHAAYAAIGETPNPALPPERLLAMVIALLPWEEWFFVGLGFVALIVAVMVVRFAIRKVNVKKAATIGIAVLATQFAQARFGFDGFFSNSGGIDAEKDLTVKVSSEPEVFMVGTEGEVVLKIECAEGVTLEPASVRLVGGDDAVPGSINFLSALEPFQDGTYRARVQCNEEGEFDLKLTLLATGSINRKTVKGNFTSSVHMMGQRVEKRIDDFKVRVAALPTEGKPEDFKGAVGRSFEIQQTVNPPRVRAGDLVSVNYVLKYDGYFPTNACAEVISGDADFKRYELKEVAREKGRIEWSQIVIPQSESARKIDTMGLSYYDLGEKKYKRVVSQVKMLEFKSADEKDEVDLVKVNVPGDSPVKVDAAAEIELRLQPRKDSPVVTRTLREKCVEHSRRGNWTRFESSDGAGWAQIMIQ